jgi:hypothetical protein
VATFGDLVIDTAATGYSLTASGTGLTGATSGTFNITVGAASQLVFTVQPVGTTGGATMAPVTVTVEDLGGNTVSFNGDITVAIGTNPGSGTLTGTIPMTAVNGVATFSDLSIDNPGVGYTLTASGDSLSGFTSSLFDIT